MTAALWWIAIAVVALVAGLALLVLFGHIVGVIEDPKRPGV